MRLRAIKFKYLCVFKLSPDLRLHQVYFGADLVILTHEEDGICADSPYPHFLTIPEEKGVSLMKQEAKNMRQPHIRSGSLVESGLKFVMILQSRSQEYITRPCVSDKLLVKT
ncbi:hypothetical protein AVEN_54436-1 [Araneus ventricosus]|uniref:Uncharacterized protein n=1 Tax=Araneus ventricosus TaxID=182803 RepID=A0A4Y2DBN4_ARAVE|nr:hypothetical protein AVEN_54436-1 [Araneus ventricosus]